MQFNTTFKQVRKHLLYILIEHKTAKFLVYKTAAQHMLADSKQFNFAHLSNSNL